MGLGLEILAACLLLIAFVSFVVCRRAMPVRAWSYLRFLKKKQVPPDVKSYLLNNGIKTLRKAKGASPEQQLTIAEELLRAALFSEPGDLDRLPSELIGEGMTRLAQIPLEHCTNCDAPVFTHEAINRGGLFYCKNCARLAKKS